MQGYLSTSSTILTRITDFEDGNYGSEIKAKH